MLLLLLMMMMAMMAMMMLIVFVSGRVVEMVVDLELAIQLHLDGR